MTTSRSIISRIFISSIPVTMSAGGLARMEFLTGRLRPVRNLCAEAALPKVLKSALMNKIKKVIILVQRVTIFQRILSMEFGNPVNWPDMAFPMAYYVRIL